MKSESNKMNMEINHSKRHKIIITVLFISLKQNNDLNLNECKDFST